LGIGAAALSYGELTDYRDSIPERKTISVCGPVVLRIAALNIYGGRIQNLSKPGRILSLLPAGFFLAAICAVTAQAHNEPPGGVDFIEPSFWQSYRWAIIGVISLCIVEAILIARLLVQRSYRTRVQEGFRESERALRESHSQIKDLAGQLIEAQDRERQHIAREIHDDLTQRVAVIGVGLSALKRRFPETDVAVRQRILLLQEEIDGLVEWIRRLSHELHSPTLHHFGLVAALKNYCQGFTSQHGIVVNLNIADAAEPIEANASLCVYRVVQEALHNIAKHAHVQDAEVKLTREHDGLSLTILDHGAGFDPKIAAVPGHGLGLISMGERVKLLNGAFQINTAPGTGTEIRVWIPLRNNHAKSASVAGR
jgi:two-component system sensor histidine kinase UhpB